MTTEQKAKAYDEALEKAKKLQKTCDSQAVVGWCEYLFPELAESEDERIRKELIDFFSRGAKHGSTTNNIPDKEIVAWLENQGQHKPADKIEPKFHKGEWIVSNNKKSIYQVIEVKRGIYVVRDNADNREYHIDIEAAERSGRLLTIQDAKDGDVLYSPCLKLLWIFKDKSSVYCGCNLTYNNGEFCGEGYIEMPTDAIPATKEQRDTLEKAMADAGYTFDFKKKELKKIEDEEPQKDSLILLIMQSGTPIVAKIIEPNHTFNHGERWAYIDDLLEKQGDSPIKWNKNTEGNKPQINHSVLMKTTHGIAEGEWQGEYWHQYRWAGIVRDSDVLSWVELSDLEKQGEQKPAYNSCESAMDFKIEAGKWYICIKDYYYSDIDELMFTKGKAYKAYVDWGFISNNGTKKTPINMFPYKEYFRPATEEEIPHEQKSAWSEEDEEILQGIWDEISAKKYDAKEYEWDTYDKYLSWLESLKNRYTWKPTEEQMDALADALSLAKNCGEGSAFDLRTLHEQLKKL